MSEQAQATTTTGTTARSKPRTRPSRARGAARPGQQQSARTNGASKPKPAAAAQRQPTKPMPEATQQEPEARTGGEGMDRDEAARAAATEEARQQEEAARVEAERQEIAEKEATHVRELLANHQAFMAAASASFGQASAGLAEISAILTWEPTRLAEVDAAVSKVARGLTDFRTYLARADGLAVEPYLRAPEADLGGCFGLTLDAMRELHRRIGAQIALMETDVGNVPALLAIERAVMEQAQLTTTMNRGLGRLLVQEGIAR